jgi:DNA polymerase-3 subunit delta'
MENFVNLNYRSPAELLEQQKQNGRLAQSYIFLGPKGSGKKATAMELASQLSPASSGIFLADGSTAGVDEIRELIGFLALRPEPAGQMVAIVENAEQLSTSSFNSLLKTIEEPFVGSVVILLANFPRLPVTIVSRCQVIRFGQAVSSVASENSNELGLGEILQSSKVDRAAKLLTLAEGESSAIEQALARWIREALKLSDMVALKKSSTVLLEAWQRLKQNANKKMIAQYVARNL